MTESPSSPANTVKKTNWVKEIIFFILKLGITVGIIYWLLHEYDASFYKRLLSIPLWAITAMFGCQIFQHIVSAARWKYLLKLQQISISFFEAITLNWLSFFYSLCLPGGALGGDVVKVAIICKRLPKGQRLEPAFTILIDRIVGMVSLFGMILLLFPLVWIYREEFSEKSLIILWILYPLCLTGVCGAFALFFHREIARISFINKIIHWVDGKTHGKIERLFDSFDLYRGAMGSIVAWVLVGIFFIHVPAAIIVYIAAVAILAAPPPFVELLFTTSAANIAGMLPTIGGLGTREGTNKILMSDMTSCNAEDVMLPIMAYMAVLVIFNLLGGIWMFIKTRNSIVTEPTE